jgi:purine-nucleoside phosphorylase
VKGIAMGKVQEAAEMLRERTREAPEVLLVLGSGLGELAEEVEDPVAVPYGDIPGFPLSTVEGHVGRFVFGRLEGVPVAAMQGRFHLYEGWSPAEVVLPVRVAAELGARAMLVTNAAGGASPHLSPGDLMLITDHINATGTNPLVGPVVEGEIRFPDMTEPYDAELRAGAEEKARELGIHLRQGVYCSLLGPSYETPSEVRMLIGQGADAVGMSTVPEVIVARARGVRVLGISCITNPAAGISPEPLSHQEVVEVGARVRGTFTRLVRGVLPGVAAAVRE